MLVILRDPNGRRLLRYRQRRSILNSGSLALEGCRFFLNRWFPWAGQAGLVATTKDGN